MRTRIAVPSSYIGSIAGDHGSLPEPIRQALLSVPRHRFLDGWFQLEFDKRRLAFHHVDFDKESPSDEQLSLIYSDQALVTAHDQLFPTSSTSQPSLVAGMLQLLDVSPGMRILEIGTGTGYNAALLAELSGNPANICTIECQQNVAEKAKRFLTEEGYGDVHVVWGDGFHGVRDGAPFDRIIATVGCSDLSPHWLKQLSPEGKMLIPLNQGFSDPLALLERDLEDPACAVGTIVDRSAFMKIRGILEWGNLWRTFTLQGLPDKPEWCRSVLEHLDVSARSRHPVSSHNHWSFHFFLSLCSRELWYDNRGYGLADPGSRSVILLTAEGIKAFSATGDSEACEHLYRRLLAIHARWIRLGCPAPADYALSFQPKCRFTAPPQDPAREWVIERLRFLERIRLA